MRQKIKNTLTVSVDEVDLTTVYDIEFYIRQGNVFFQYTPVVLGVHEMIVTIPKKDADTLRANIAGYLQFAFTDADGNHIASEIVETNIDRLLKTEGYDGA